LVGCFADTKGAIGLVGKKVAWTAWVVGKSGIVPRIEDGQSRFSGRSWTDLEIYIRLSARGRYIISTLICRLKVVRGLVPEATTTLDL
jgi:hypothetical protein